MQYVVQVQATLNGRVYQPGETISAEEVGPGAHSLLRQQYLTIAPPDPVRAVEQRPAAQGNQQPRRGA